MYNSAFCAKTMRSELKKKDFLGAPKIGVDSWLKGEIQQALDVAKVGFGSGFPLRKDQRKGKTVWRVESLPYDLVLRKLSSNISKLTKVKQSSRDLIVGDLIGFLEADVTYRFYKLDVKSFYETIDPQLLLLKLHHDTSVSRPTARLIGSFFEEMNDRGILGLPRGISLSATLSELLMRTFDSEALSREGVFFYNRFVDDIAVITDGSEDPQAFVDWLSSKLPHGLEFNTLKTDEKLIKREPKKCTLDALRHKFNYLGYEYAIHNPSDQNEARRVLVDISNEKVKRIKTKVALSFLDYMKNGDFDLLDMRLRYLTSNYAIYDPDEDRVRMAGIFYNYKRVNVIEGGRLIELDKYMKALLLSGKGRLATKIGGTLSKNQKKRLLAYSFFNGFTRKIKYHFCSDDYLMIKRCWPNV